MISTKLEEYCNNKRTEEEEAEEEKTCKKSWKCEFNCGFLVLTNQLQSELAIQPDDFKGGLRQLRCSRDPRRWYM
jgi:hypothetical protein